MSNYWNNTLTSRRAAMRGAAIAGAGVAALSLVGCGGDDSSTTSAGPAQEVIDSTKGTPGGTLHVQAISAPPSFLALAGGGGGHYRQLVYSGLINFDWGRAGHDGLTLRTQPDTAQANPEQPDEKTYIFKLKPGIKFQNGRTLTAEDAAYSLNRSATWPQAPRRNFWFWMDKVETPDSQTVVVKATAPYGDALFSMTCYADAYMLAKEHEEGPDGATKPMGTGPYNFVSFDAPVTVAFKKNQDYFDKPYPYFDEIKTFTAGDAARRITDFTTRQLHTTWWQAEEARDQIKKERPDANMWGYPAAGWATWVRNDQRPLNDKRVRQALGMTIDRKAIRQAVSNGEGEDDQVCSFTNTQFGWRRPKDLGPAAKYSIYDPAEAKKLMAAAGVDRPIETNWTHFDGSIDGQAAIDQAVLTQAKWKELGLANIKDISMTSPQFNAGPAVGNYEGFALRPGSNSITPGATLRSVYFSPPEGVKTPTTNVGYVNNPTLNALLDKQAAQIKHEERTTTMRQIEELMAEEQYRLIFSTLTNNWFADPSVTNISMPFMTFTAQFGHAKYWWFKK